MSFSSDIAKFAKKANATVDQVTRVVKIKLFNGIIEDTRVDTGRLKGNWQTSTGSPNLTTTERLDKTGSKAKSEVLAVVGGDTVDYMSNNLPYAKVYEDKDGMIAKNITRINRNLKEAIREST